MKGAWVLVLLPSHERDEVSGEANHSSSPWIRQELTGPSRVPPFRMGVLEQTKVLCHELGKRFDAVSRLGPIKRP